MNDSFNDRLEAQPLDDGTIARLCTQLNDILASVMTPPEMMDTLYEALLVIRKQALELKKREVPK